MIIPSTIDYFWSPQKRKYGVTTFSSHFEIEKIPYFKSRKSAARKVRQMRKLFGAIVKVLKACKKYI